MNILPGLFLLLLFGCQKSDPKPFEELSQGKVTFVKAPLPGDDFSCDQEEEFRYETLKSCGDLVIFRKTQIKGCWGMSGTGALLAATPVIGIMDKNIEAKFGHSDSTPIYLAGIKTCPDLLVRLPGNSFGRRFENSGYGRFDYEETERKYSRYVQINGKYQEFDGEGNALSGSSHAVP